MLRRWAGACLGGGALLLAAPAPAQRPPRPAVHLQLPQPLGPACSGVDPQQLARLFAIELGTELRDQPAPLTTVAGVQCGAAQVELRVDDPLTGKSLRRSVDLLGAATAARSRLLALALAELIFTSWSELEAPAPPPLPPVGPAAPAAVRAAASALLQHRRQSPAPGLRLLAVAAVHGGFAGSGALGGGGLRLGGDLRHHLAFSADLLAHHGDQRVALGRLTADTLTSALTFGGYGRLRALTLRGGAGLRLGAARLSGEPADPGQALGGALWGLQLGPQLQGSASLPLARHLVAELALEAGYGLTPLAGRVDGERALALEGPWIGAQLGIGVTP